MKIRVTEEHIRKGLPTDCEFCPVAIAVAEAYGVNHDQVSVDDDSIWVLGEGTAPSPKEVLAFIEAFDEGYAVGPFEFELCFDDTCCQPQGDGSDD